MTILVIGATGTVGRQVVDHLLRRGAGVRALARDPAKANLPSQVEVVQGDLLDIDSVRSAFTGVSTLFLLTAVAADEFTQALIALNIARESGIERIVYLSVLKCDAYVNVPHFAAKFGVERMIEQMGMKATILRPSVFMSNDARVAGVIRAHGVYPNPVSPKGVALIDVGDIGEIAAIELLRRERADAPLPIERYDVVGPDLLTGPEIAAIWSEVLGRPVVYPGGDASGVEQNLRAFAPSWMAFDVRLMFERLLSDGVIPASGDVERLTKLLGRPLRSYREFAAAVAATA